MDDILTVEQFSLDLRREKVWNPILHEISFLLKKGETLGIVGESGSGKSVTALSIMRLLDSKMAKNSGKLLFFDSNLQKQIALDNLPEKEMRKIRGDKIAMIFQEPMTSLNPVMKCGAQITEALLLHTKLSKKDAKLRVIELFHEVMLPRPEKIFEAYPFELSGGQKQRVMIALAMSCNPDILIADEPTTALDVTVQKGILELIKKLQVKYNMSVIFITHDLGVVVEIADRVLVMYKGEIVERGDAKQLFAHPEHPYTQGLLACRPSMERRLKLLPTVDDFMRQQDDFSSVSLSEKLNKLTISNEERVNTHKKLYASEPILKIENLCKTYPLRKEKLFEKRQYLKALDQINLEVYEGETLGLVGESGCGKTTLGRAVIRLIEPTAGHVYYKGMLLNTLSPKALRKVRKELQIILQDPYSSLNQRIKIGDALMEPMRVHGLFENDKQRKRKAIELLERVSLDETHFYRYPHEFSGGQRQRIAIARALAVNPRFIICDESVSALDVSVQAQVLNLLNELKREFGLTYIFISHDLSVVKFMSDRMAVMKEGKIVELNEADEIYRHPATPYTQQLIDAIPGVKSVFV